MSLEVVQQIAGPQGVQGPTGAAGAAATIAALTETYDFTSVTDLAKWKMVSTAASPNLYPSDLVVTPTQDAGGVGGTAGVAYAFYKADRTPAVKNKRSGSIAVTWKIGDVSGTFQSGGVIVRAADGSLIFLRYERNASVVSIWSHIASGFASVSSTAISSPAANAIAKLVVTVDGDLMRWTLYINGVKTNSGTYTITVNALLFADNPDTEMGLWWEPTTAARIQAVTLGP